MDPLTGFLIGIKRQRERRKEQMSFSLIPFSFLFDGWGEENARRVRNTRKRGRKYLEEGSLSPLLDVFEGVLEFQGGRGRLDQRMKVEDNKITLEIEMPGVKKEEVEVLEKDGVFSFKWKREEREYSRVYNLPRNGEGWNLEECKLRLEDGILILEVFKKEREGESPLEGRKIPIE